MSGKAGFAQWYVCERCGWHGGLDDGLCILCQNDPALTTEPVTIPAHVVLELAHRWCNYCGDPFDGVGELCGRCHTEITATTEPSWRERYV